MIKILRNAILWLGFGAFIQFKIRLFPGKFKSKWTGPYLIIQIFPHRAVEFENKEGVLCKVNGQRIKIYLGHAEMQNEVIE